MIGGVLILAAAMTGAVSVCAGLAVRNRSLRSLLTVAACFQLSLTAFAIAALALGWGHMTGFSLPDPYAQGNGMVRDRNAPQRYLVTKSWFPVSVVCSDGPDGTDGDEQVPGWVNPTVFAASGVGIAALAATPFTARQRRRRPDPGKSTAA
ncbi:hypothetical protein [Streptomyces sp. AB3(2024)]|uniref:hypothetical protein n=1 Tax=Streptomyces sp. AB3(2024) TaxID=3317321 RepID=UPI0035A3733E